MNLLVLFLTIPLMMAFIGYVTNWAAVKLIFHPREFVGIGRIGWQGIVYRMGDKLASELAQTTRKVLSPVDVLERLAPHALAERLVKELGADLEAVVADVLDAVRPGTWAGMAPAARTQLLDMVVVQLGEMIEQTCAELAEHGDEILDVQSLVIDMFTGEHRDRLGRVAQDVCAKELRFVELYGGAFGLVIGLVQALAYTALNRWWLMPLVGGAVGLGTNWLAIQMIFRPLEPRRYLGFITYQGMFPKRQDAIAADYGRILATEVLTPANLVSHVAHGPGSAQAAAFARSQFESRIEELQPLMAMFAGDGEASDDGGRTITRVLEARFAELAPKAVPIVEAHLAEHLGLDEVIYGRLAAMNELEFERLLRGIFEEDEILLVLVGGVLGALIGGLQGAVVLVLNA